MIPERLDRLFDQDTPPAAREENRESLRKGISNFLAALAEQTSKRSALEGVVDCIFNEIEFVSILAGMESVKKLESEAITFAKSQIYGEGCEFNHLFLMLFLILHRISEVTDPESPLSASALRCHDFGLERIIEMTLHACRESTPPLESPWGSGTGALLLGVLLAHQSLFAGSDEKDLPQWVRRLFDDEEARQFLLVHRSNGSEWFNRERFEDLIGWLYLADMFSYGAETFDDKLSGKIITHGHAMVMDLLAKAETAQYRTDIFVSLL